MDPLLEKIHGNNVHVGKTPLTVLEEEKKTRDPEEEELDKLRSELQVLVAEERFEEAAIVRDKIRELEARIEGTS